MIRDEKKYTRLRYETRFTFFDREGIFLLKINNFFYVKNVEFFENFKIEIPRLAKHYPC